MDKAHALKQTMDNEHLRQACPIDSIGTSPVLRNPYAASIFGKSER
jgi:hypothetical protein